MSRTTARKHAFALVFQMEFHKDTPAQELLDIYFDNHTLADEDKAFISAEFQGTFDHVAQIDKILGENLKGWTIDRLSKTDIAIMRLAIYELMFEPEIPVSVSVNEAVELAKNYSMDDATGFVNGVLGSAAKLSGKKIRAQK